MKKSKLPVIVVELFVALMLVSCSNNEFSEDLNIHDLIMGSSTATKNCLAYEQTSVIHLKLNTAKTEDVEVEWIASGGSFTSTKNNEATWKAPLVKGTYEIAVNLTHKGNTRQHTLKKITVVGTFYDSLTTLNSTIWNFDSNTTNYKHSKNNLEISLKENASYAVTNILLQNFLGTTNKPPQSVSAKIKSHIHDFSNDDDNYLIYYNLNKPINIEEEDKYINSVIFRIYPKIKKCITQFIVHNPVTATSQIFSINQPTNISPDFWNENEFNHVGMEINNDFKFNFYINKRKLISYYITNTLDNLNIKYSSQAQIPVFHILNNKTITISDIIFDNTNQRLYDYEDVIGI